MMHGLYNIKYVHEHLLHQQGLDWLLSVLKSKSHLCVHYIQLTQMELIHFKYIIINMFMSINVYHSIYHKNCKFSLLILLHIKLTH